MVIAKYFNGKFFEGPTLFIEGANIRAVLDYKQHFPLPESGRGFVQITNKGKFISFHDIKSFLYFSLEIYCDNCTDFNYMQNFNDKPDIKNLIDGKPIELSSYLPPHWLINAQLHKSRTARESTIPIRFD